MFVFVLARALTYSTLFIGFGLVFLPSRVLAAAAVHAPSALGPWQAAGLLVGAAGTAIVAACVLTFVVVGRGTPAPFDPPRRLVIKGPYRHVRNPMYLGAATAMLGAALFYRSAALVAYVGAFLLVLHLFVVIYEEPTLGRSFGPDYEGYCRRVRRWWIA